MEMQDASPVDQQDDNHEVQRPSDRAVQVDESADVSDLPILLVIARYFNINEFEENLLLCYPLTKICTGEDIFNAIQDYFCENEIDWAKCCDVCTDGGKSMSGCYKGLRGRIKIVTPHVAWSLELELVLWNLKQQWLLSPTSLESLLHPQTKINSEAFARFIEGSIQSICQSCKFH
ncbi:Zinc finger BED domain-containing protein 5 [Araneus ventricosus]|uniref:Zinc finger BED domain-containing protein 5 n=1 Tax=Araneus ventricosus TaxID=182803 RepID=A0A4Y2B5Y7_ARAVE|nr:Zinc finger BED domain-containing protein 5 [Araneus ventricosus]